MSPVALTPNPQTEHHGIFQVIEQNFFSIPFSVRMVSLSLFLFVFGRGLGADVFFSLYIKSIVDHVFRISVISALLSLGKMFFSLPVGEIDDHADLKSVLFLSKGIYVIVGISYLLAGILHSLLFLLIAVLLNGFATAALWTTYQTFIRKHTKSQTRSRAFGLYFSSINLAYILGALISSYLITITDLPHLFIFISLFACISLFTDNQLPSLSKKKIRAFLGRDTFVHKFFVSVFSLQALKHVFKKLKTYTSRMYYALGFEFLFNVLNYIGFIFIPIVSVANHLNLSQVALVFATMRIPYLIDFFTGNIADHTSKRKFLFLVLLFLSLLFFLLGSNEGFWNIMIISFGISLGLSLMRPVISSYISDCTRPEDEGTISGVAEFVGKLGEIVGVLGFGICSAFFDLQNSFVFFAILIFVIAVVGIIQRFHLFSVFKR